MIHRRQPANVKLWRVDAQHGDFDGAFTRIYQEQAAAQYGSEKLAAYGWHTDFYAFTVSAEPATVERLCSMLWPCATTEQILQIADAPKAQAALWLAERIHDAQTTLKQTRA